VVNTVVNVVYSGTGEQDGAREDFSLKGEPDLNAVLRLPGAMQKHQRISASHFLRHHHFDILGAVHDLFARLARVMTARIKEADPCDVVC